MRMARRSENKRTYSKRMVKHIMWVALLDLQLTYVLAFLGREQIAETLSSDICHVIIGVGLGYFLKVIIFVLVLMVDEKVLMDINGNLKMKEL